MDFGRVLGRFWEAKIIYFPTFFNVFLKLKFERCFESKNLRKKRQTDAGVTSLTPSWAGPAECAGCWGEKKRGVQKLAGTEFWKKIYSRQTL